LETKITTTLVKSDNKDSYNITEDIYFK